MLAIIGEHFDVGNEVCGAVISVRFSEDILSIWNRNADNTEATAKLAESCVSARSRCVRVRVTNARVPPRGRWPGARRRQSLVEIMRCEKKCVKP